MWVWISTICFYVLSLLTLSLIWETFFLSIFFNNKLISQSVTKKNTKCRNKIRKQYEISFLVVNNLKISNTFLIIRNRKYNEKV